MAEEQFAGRGQVSNVWLSEPGKNLTFSILLRPTFLDPGKQFMLNKCISIAVNEVLRKILGPAVKVKWPNDIYWGDQKFGGMLIENIIRGNRWNYAIIGIGINVNQVNFAPELKNVTSIAKILQSDYDLPGLLSEICSHTEAWYLRLKAGHLEEISARYLDKLYRLQQPHRYYSENQQEFTGTITDVTDEGWLQVLSGETVHSFAMKEIEFLTD